MLQNPSVKTWLAGVEPAWTLPDQASFAALHEPPSPMAGPIRLAADLTQAEVQQSAVALNACTSRPLSIRKWIGAQLKLDNQRA
jgi:hypothetical protein